MWKRDEIAAWEHVLLFSTVFCYLFLDFHVKIGTRISLQDKRSRDNEGRRYIFLSNKFTYCLFDITRKDVYCLALYCKWKYSRLSLSRIPTDFLKYFEISVPRHIRIAELRKKINRTTRFYKFICDWTLEIRDNYNIVEKRRNCPFGAISPLFHNILLHVVRFSSLDRD